MKYKFMLSKIDGSDRLSILAKSSWQHIWNERHISISDHQRKRLVSLFRNGYYLDDPTIQLYYNAEPGRCPHCTDGSIRLATPIRPISEGE